MTSQLVARPPIHSASFERWNSDRHDDIFLYAEDDTERLHGFRYKLSVIDRIDTARAKSSNTSCSSFNFATAVFLIPAGRESEYMFQSATGLNAIAQSAGTARLIAVTFGRPPHIYQSQASVQDELTYVVQILAARQGLGSNNNAVGHIHEESTIPFLALDGIGERNVLATGSTKCSGRYLVEQCVADARQQVRRLYFLDGNPFVIQSEVGLKQSTEKEWVVDKSHTAFDYHASLTAGIMSRITSGNSNSAGMAGMLIGLGGGGLVNLWHELNTKWNVTAIELDPKVVEIAVQYFGLDREKIQVICGDGLAVHSSLEPKGELSFPPASLDFIVIDVDSKDTEKGMSCPPAAFVETEYLQSLLGLLRPDNGVLAINVSARDPILFSTVCQTVSSVFPFVFQSKKCPGGESDTIGGEESEDEEDLNVVVFASCSNPHSELVMKDMTESLSHQLQHSTDETIKSELLSCLDDIVTYNINDAVAATSLVKKSKNYGGKRRNKKRGKKR